MLDKFQSVAEQLIAEKGDVAAVASLLAIVTGQSTSDQVSLITQAPVCIVCRPSIPLYPLVLSCHILSGQPPLM